MSLPLVASLAGTAAAFAWADAKFHLQHDISRGVLRNIPREAQEFLQSRVKENRMMPYHDLEYWAQQDLPDHIFLRYQRRSWTYRQFFDQVVRVANWLMNDLGVQRHEIVALDGPNSPEYIMLWLALDSIGACQAFVNYNLTGTALSHSVKLCKPRYVFAENEMRNNVEPCRDELEQAGIQIIYYEQDGFPTLHDATPIPRSRTAGFVPSDLRSLIYTSGTTGLPKGVFLGTGRNINAARTFGAHLHLRPGVKMYTCLPLYHASAQTLCAAPVMRTGATLCLGRRFSHRTFWTEVADTRAEIIQYVGELCRYLVNAPTHPDERRHVVHTAFGNGMRADVWEPFRARFNIPTIFEFYAATDGLGASLNRNRGAFTAHAIGLRGALWHWKNSSAEARVRIDPDTEEIARDAHGFAMRCAPNEPGESLNRVDPAAASMSFRGYFDNDGATQKRWLRDVFVKGDMWLRSGDLMREDAEGRLFFVDRLGDTFRWKSENVSAGEVADVLGTAGAIAEANVYGVAVPRADGRCGCAMVVLRKPGEGLDGAALGKHVLARLPRYAAPLFLRVVPQLTYTGTFKIQKGQAKREGIDVEVIEKAAPRDRMYWLPPGKSEYCAFGREEWRALKEGKVVL